MKKRYTKFLFIVFLIFSSSLSFGQYTASNLETGNQNVALAKDASGNIYTTRFQSAGLYKVVKYTNGAGSPTDVYTGLVADGGDFPLGLAVAANGDVYISTSFSDSDGKIIRLNASSSYAATTVQTGRYFTGLAFDNQNRLYALEYNTGASKYAVVRYNNPATVNSTGTTLYTNITSETGLSYPTSISVALNGTIYFNNVFNTDGGTTYKGGIVKLTTTDGTTYTKSDLNTTNYTSAVFVDEFNNLYAIEAPGANYKLYKYTNGTGTGTEFYSATFAGSYPYLAYGVTAFNNIVYAIDGDNGSSGSRLLKLTPTDVTPPSVPTGLTASALGGSKIVLNWTANNVAEGVSGYRIYGGTSANPGTLIGSVASGTTTFTHTGLTNAQQYFYKISAVDIYFNEGAKTADQTATTAKPVISSAAYNANTKVLTVTGTNFLALTGAANDISISKLTLTAEGSTSRTLSASDVEITNATTFSVTLSVADQNVLNVLFNKNGTSSTGGTTYNLAVATGWAAAEEVSVNTAQTTIGVTVSNVPVPTITSATYNAQTGVLVVTGTNFYKLNGSTNDIDATKFVFAGENANTYTLQTTSNVEITSATSFSLTLSTSDKVSLSTILNKNGTASVSNNTYNIAALDRWNAGADAATNIADLTGNGVTVSNFFDYVLPIQLVDFSHKINNNEVVLNWSTSSETNNKEFKLSRSADGKVFTTIGTVAGSGNSANLLKYSFVDKTPVIGQSYYKLTQIDHDNVVKLEKLMPVNFNVSGEDVSIYPNPVTDVVSVKASNNRYKKATISDMSGKVLGTYVLSENVTAINMTNFPKGVYLLKLSSDSEHNIKKIVKN